MRKGDEIYLRLYPAGPKRDTLIRIGMRPATAGATILDVYEAPKNTYEGYVQKYQRMHGAYVSVQRWRDFAEAESGVVTLEVNTPERIVGRYAVSAREFVESPDTGRVLRLEGKFDATLAHFAPQPGAAAGARGERPVDPCLKAPPN